MDGVAARLLSWGIKSSSLVFLVCCVGHIITCQPVRLAPANTRAPTQVSQSPAKAAAVVPVGDLIPVTPPTVARAARQVRAAR